MFVILENAGKHVLYIAQVMRSMYSNIIGGCTTVRAARRFYRKFNPAMEPIKVVQLLNLSNEALNMKSGVIGHSAFRCDQYVIGIGFQSVSIWASPPGLELVSAKSWHLVPSGTKKKESK